MPANEAPCSIHCASFDAERFWKDPEQSKLPALPDKEAGRIVDCMDELLFVFTKPGDVLLTRTRMQPAHRQYLRMLGFQFVSNDVDLGVEQDGGKSIFQLMAEYEYGAYLQTLCRSAATLEPFAITPCTQEAASKHGWLFEGPPISVIRQVNAKRYSTQMKDRLGLKNVSVIVEDSASLEQVGREFIQSGAFLIKDDFGVSGTGNLLIDSIHALERITSYIRGQEQKGRRTFFILEPFLDKEVDFSCQFHIKRDGSYQLLSVQKLANAQFSYQESSTPDPAFRSMLEKERYFEWMEQVAKLLHQDGYFGHVCIDSMLLKDGSLVPIVEINARKSMSLIKHQMDEYAAKLSLGNSQTYYAFSHTGNTFEALLQRMEEERLLFHPDRGAGVIPMTANTVERNWRPDRPFRGRLYASLVGSTEEERSHAGARMRLLLGEMSFQLLN